MNEQVRVTPARDWTAAFTADEFLHMVELGAFADMRAELVRGEIEKMMPAEWTHGELNARLAGLLFPLARASEMRIGTDVVIRIDTLTVRAFDLVVLRPEALPDKVLQGSEILLAVEVAETSQARDLGEKREEYGSVGIPLYWVVDSVARVTHCFRLDESGTAYGPATVIAFGETIEMPELSGALTID